MNAEHHLGQSQGELRVIGADAVRAGERELEPAAEGKTVDGRNARKGQRIELIEYLLSGAHQSVALLGRTDIDELLDVGAGYETAALRGAHDEADRLLRSDLRERGSQILDDRRRQHVGRAPRHVAAEPGDPIGIDVESPGTGHCHAAARADSWMVKSQMSGRWSDNWMSGISKRFTSICELCRMKSSSLRGLELG